jgi:hypothetical protein
MYKVITHTIKEEHFTHPATAEYALTGGHMGNAHVYSGHMGGHMGNVMARTSAIVGEFNTPMALLYRAHIKDCMESYIGNLRGELVSIHGTGEEVALLEQRIVKSIEDLVSKLTPYYNANVTAVVKQALVEYSMELMNLVRAHKDGRSTSDAEAKIAQKMTAIADFLPSINPHWVKEDLVMYFNCLTDAFKNQSIARKAKNWAEDQKELDNARECATTGVPGQGPSLSQYVARGVISQFPMKFR